MSALKYRPDIDGLRAVAVLLVLLYHAGLWDVDGGYVGVDVFFVISGFLITSLIKSDLERGSFGFADFWERRIRRILPALGVVTVVTLAAGWFLYLPQDYAVLGKQAASQAVFSSNILFYSISGYFTAENATKPLLHTWSLAVEEQYYFIVPFLLAGLFAKMRGRMVAVLAVLAFASFAASVWAVRVHPEAAFYLLPFRAWELLVGSLLAFAPERPLQARDKKINDILAALGLAAILAAAFFYTSKTPFPGMAALMPCLGAAAIIYAGRTPHGTYVCKLLSLRPVVFIGLISYSLYLWHWPVLMFVEYIPLVETRPVHRIGLLLLSGFLAWLSWKYIEQPCRKRGKEGGKIFAYGAAFAGLIAVALTGLYISKNEGMAYRWSPEALQYAAGAKDGNIHANECTNKTAEDMAKKGICESNPAGGEIDFIVWGDSFADAAMPLFYELSKKHGKNGYLAAQHSCPPIIGALQKDASNSPTCDDFNKAIFEKIKREKIKRVFIVGNFEGWFRNRSIYFEDMDWYDSYKEKYSSVSAAGLQRTLDLLKNAGAHPYVVISTPIAPFNPPLALALEEQMKLKNRKAYIDYPEYLKERVGGIDDLVRENQGDKDITLIDMSQTFCDEKKCDVARDGYALYRDRTHLSARGILYMAPLFDPVFKNM